MVFLHIYLLLLQHSTSVLIADRDQLIELQKLEESSDTPSTGNEVPETSEEKGNNTTSLLFSFDSLQRIQAEWDSHRDNTNKVISSPLKALLGSGSTREDRTNESHQSNDSTDGEEHKNKGLNKWADVALLDPESTLTRAQSIVKSIVTLLLPFFYACMGALIYILRTISGELNSMQYSRARMTQYSLRLPMGIVAGVSIGFLFQPETYNSLSSSLTPLGIAFIAGYSVELLFNIVDRVIEAFVDDKHKTQPEVTSKASDNTSKDENQ